MLKTILSILALTTVTVANAEVQDSIIAGESMQDVVVTGSRKAVSLSNLPMTVSTVSRETLTENQRFNILPTLTEQVPGLFATSRGIMGYGVSGGAAGGMMLRGISSGAGQMMVLIDGHPQYQGVYGHSISDSYQTMMIDHVEVMRGPASLLYGSNAMGGVINIITRKNLHAKDEVFTIDLGAGSYGTFQAELGHQWRKNRFSSSFGANYTRSDNHRPNMGFEQYGFFKKLDYEINANWNAYADINLTHFNASQPGTISDPMLEADQWITRGVASIGLENHYDNMNGRISVYSNFGRHKINDGYKANGGKPKEELFRSKDALTGVSLYECFKIWQGSNVTLGFDYQNIYGRAYYTNREDGHIETTKNNRGIQSGHAHNDEIAGYLDLRQDLLSWLTVDAGIRYDHHSTTGNEWIPQFGIAIRPMENGTLKLMAGKGFRNPSMKEMYLYASANDELKPERLMNYEISWKHSLINNRLRYGINLFYLDVDNIVETVSVDGKMKNINSGELKNKGFEIEASYIISKHWSLNTNHSYLHMDNPIVSAPKYKGYLGAHTHYGKWSATIGAMLVNGLYTQVGKTETKENFTLVNATVNYSLCHNLRLWVKGENLLAQKYEYVLGYPMPRATFMAGVNVEF